MSTGSVLLRQLLWSAFSPLLEDTHDLLFTQVDLTCVVLLDELSNRNHIALVRVTETVRGCNNFLAVSVSRDDFFLLWYNATYMKKRKTNPTNQSLGQKRFGDTKLKDAATRLAKGVKRGTRRVKKPKAVR